MSPIAAGISIGMAILGLRGLWKIQRRLDLRGYVIQGLVVAIGALLIVLEFPPNQSIRAMVLSDLGIVMVIVFLLFPSVVYYLLRFYDRRRSRNSDNTAVR